MANEKLKMIMINAVSKALNFKNSNPSITDEKVLEHVMDELNVNTKLKIVAIAAVARALKYRSEKGGNEGNDRNVMQRILDEADEIIKASSA